MTKVKAAGSYKIDMCTGPILPKMLRFALPLMASSLLQLLFNAADIIVVGQFCGDIYTAAVGSNGALINLLTNFFIGLSVGTNVLAARYYGADNHKDLSETVHTSMLISVISGVLLTIVGLFAAGELLKIMNTPENVLGLATEYLEIYFLGVTATTIYNFGSALLRAIGDTKRPLYYLFISGVLNVVLNLFFVIVFDLDVAGVAIATVISQITSAVLVVRCLMRETGGIKLVVKKLHIHRDKLLQIIKIGLPAGIQGTLFSLSNVVIQSSINLFGDNVVSGNADAANIEGFVYVAMNAFYQAVISFTSQNLGRRNFDRIKRSLLIGLACVTVTGVLLGLVLIFFGRELMGIYTSTEVVIEVGLERFAYVGSIYFLCGIMDCLVGGLRGIGYSFAPMVVSLMGACVLRLVWIATVFNIPEYHVVETVYISYPISWIVTAAVHAVCFIFLFRRVKRKYTPEVIPEH